MSAREAIGVLTGGDSPEREVSLSSGRYVHEALENLGHSSRLIAIDTLDDLVPRLGGVGIVFNCLHGGAGEDGTVQLLLDVMGIPYVGSGAQACARAMEKPRAKELFVAHGLPVPQGTTYQEGDLGAFLRDTADQIGFPMVVKPANAGSTVAVFYVENEDGLRIAAENILDRFPSLIAEEYVCGREITVGILRVDETDIALPVVEIRLPGKMFDYDAKYTEGVAEFLAPAPLDDAVARAVQDVSLQAHRILGCFGFSRVDLRLAETGTPYVLEVNTLPGMTPMSDLPRAAAAADIPYNQLVEIMLMTANKEAS